jgi:hypothetical protein
LNKSCEWRGEQKKIDGAVKSIREFNRNCEFAVQKSMQEEKKKKEKKHWQVPGSALRLTPGNDNHRRFT